ncbi:MAG: pyruvate formate lyase family protein [Victivallales bacterium]
MNLKILSEIGEWAALGFYEALEQNLPWPVNYGRAMRYMYENMDVRVPEDRYLIPCEPFFMSKTMESHKLWTAAGFILDFNHHSGFKVNPVIADDRKKLFPQHAGFIDDLCADLQKRLVHFGGYTHSNPDIRRVVSEGFLSMEKELDKELAAVRAQGEKAVPAELNLLLSLREYTTGIKAYYSKIHSSLMKSVEAAKGERKRKLQIICDSFSDCFMTKSETFIGGFLAVNFTWMLDGCDSIGRFDQALGHLFEKDLKSGKLDLQFARDLLDELWQNFERMNAWNLQIGGYTPEGKDGCNELTRECILASARNKLRRPNVAFRITEKTPESFVVEALKALSRGSGRPALYNDDLYVKTLKEMDLGLNDEDSREIGFGGCTETMIAGLSNVGSLEGTINLAKALELSMFDGFDPVAKVQAGPHTGRFEDFKDFDGFLAALKRQIQYQTDSFVSSSQAELRKRFTAGDPKLYRTFFTRDCVRNRKSFEAGGARYNWAVLTYQGIANTIDSAAAIRKTVFDDKSISAGELVQALKSDFKGHEKTRQKLLASPKFGNDNDYVDEIGADLIEYSWKELYSHETPRGGRYMASCILFTTYLGAGRSVAATPDGRRAFEALVDSIGAVPGCDENGPTSLLKSIAKLPLWLAAGTPVLNLRFQKSLFNNEESIAKLARLIRAFFKQGGMQVQISVLDSKELRNAQKEPEKYKDLIVRIGGYSEYFNGLEKELQETVIKRTEHGL